MPANPKDGEKAQIKFHVESFTQTKPKNLLQPPQDFSWFVVQYMDKITHGWWCLLEVILDLVSGPSARSRRDRASTSRDSRWDEIISHPRQLRFHSRSWVEIKLVRRNYSHTYRYGTYIDVRTPSRTSREQGCRDRDVISTRDSHDLVSGCLIENHL